MFHTISDIIAELRERLEDDLNNTYNARERTFPEVLKDTYVIECDQSGLYIDQYNRLSCIYAKEAKRLNYNDAIQQSKAFNKVYPQFLKIVPYGAALDNDIIRLEKHINSFNQALKYP